MFAAVLRLRRISLAAVFVVTAAVAHPTLADDATGAPLTLQLPVPLTTGDVAVTGFSGSGWPPQPNSSRSRRASPNAAPEAVLSNMHHDDGLDCSGPTKSPRKRASYAE